MLSRSVRHGLLLSFVALLALSGLTPEASGQSLSDFVTAFQAAVQKDDFTAQGKLVDENKNHAWNAFFVFEKYWVAARRDKNEELTDQWTGVMELLASNYRGKHDDRYLSQRRVKMQSSLTEEQIPVYLEACTAGDEGYAAYQNGAADGNDESMKAAIDAYTRGARAFEKMGDDFQMATYASFLGQCWLQSGNHFNSAYWYRLTGRAAQKGGFLARFPQVNEQLDKMREKRQVEFPELINIDLDLAASKTAYEKAVSERNKIDTSTGGGEGSARGTGKGAKRDLGTLVAPSTEAEFAFVEDKGFKEKSFKLFSKIKVPYYNRLLAQPKRPWEIPFIQLMDFEKDKPAKDTNSFIPGSQLRYDGKAHLKLKGSKKEKKLKIKTKPSKMKEKVAYSDGVKRTIYNEVYDYYPERKQLFGLEFNFANPEKFLLLAWRGNTGIVGKVRGQDITILDCNGNGSFRDTGEDAVMVGKGKKARIEPLGRYVHLEDQGGLYPFEFKVNGKSGNVIRTRPYKGSLAPVVVNYATKAGLRPDFLVVKGGGEDAESYFDIAKAIDKPIWIPPGRYTVHMGYLTVGKGPKAKHILIGRGRSGVLHAESGRLNTWDLGGAGEKGFWLNGKFAVGAKSSEIEVAGQEVEVFGNHGEQYFNFGWDLRLEVEATVKKDDGNGPTLGKKGMRIRSKGNETEMWFPTDAVIKNAGSGSTKRVGQLRCKHSILGSMESEWILVQ